MLNEFKHYAMKAYGEVDIQIHIFLTWVLAGGDSSALRPGRFTPGERIPGTHWIGGWVDPRAGLDNLEKRKFLTLPGLEPRSLSLKPIASLYTDYATRLLVLDRRLRKKYINIEHK
jgi:hypothetical protein